jgi:hypothetical protein
MTKFIVNIEQPFIRAYEVEAEDEEQAEEIARARYEKDGSAFTLDELGTDYQLQVCDADGKALTEWY